MQTPLQIYANRKYRQIVNEQLTLNDMSLEDLKKFFTALTIYKSDMVAFQANVLKEIERKEYKIRRAPTTAESLILNIQSIELVGSGEDHHSLPGWDNYWGNLPSPNLMVKK